MESEEETFLTDRVAQIVNELHEHGDAGHFYRQPTPKSGTLAHWLQAYSLMQNKTINPKKIRRQLKGGADLFDFALEKLRPRQNRKLGNMFVRLGGQLVR